MTFFVVYTNCICMPDRHMSPGPSMVVVINNTIFKNKFNGIITALGHGFGIGIYAICAVIGIGFIIENSVTFFNIMKIYL